MPSLCLNNTFRAGLFTARLEEKVLGALQLILPELKEIEASSSNSETDAPTVKSHKLEIQDVPFSLQSPVIA